MEFTRTLQFSFPLVRGEDVRAVQQALTALRVQPRCGGADGVFGDRTATTLKAFQKNYNTAGRASGPALAESGQVDELTWGALFSRAKASNAQAARIQTSADALTGTLQGSSLRPTPCLNADKVRAARDWMAANFGPHINAATAGTSVDANLVYAIACQETAPVWLPWIDKMTPAAALARCVFDASGDASGTKRLAFPSDTAAFRIRYGDAFTQALIAEANETRRLRGFSDATWVYKGYGIFQYDLQHVDKDTDFFRNRRWSDFSACLDRLMQELDAALRAARGDLTDAVRRYNGAGAEAALYATNVLQMREWCAA